MSGKPSMIIPSVYAPSPTASTVAGEPDYEEVPERQTIRSSVSSLFQCICLRKDDGLYFKQVHEKSQRSWAV